MSIDLPRRRKILLQEVLGFIFNHVVNVELVILSVVQIYDDSLPTFPLRWNLFQAYSYTDRLVVIVLQKLHVHSRLGSSINLSFMCDLTLALQLINSVPLFRASSSNMWRNKPQTFQIQKMLLIKYC